MTSSTPFTALITGCSSGIGAALAVELLQRGWQVIATARRPERLQALAAAGARVMALDVSDAQSIAALASTLQTEKVALHLLVNNAGYGQFGAMLDISPAAIRQQFDTNVLAPLVVTQALLPCLLAAAPRACVAHIGSVSGVVTTPFAGAYCASKAALHAMADAMRMELLPLGIHVVTVQPGGVASRFGDAGSEQVQLPADSLYSAIADSVLQRARASQATATPADVFARGLADHLVQAQPGPLYRAGTNSAKLIWLKRLLPTRTLDTKLASLFGLTRLRR
ncbi:SDR family NAD(P)-dependent oxidoreductase [Curvibacter sp. CHRR-16]|uniref:SDR family NAD(P)-dependent oxidoreductase n=1 Tax=Curvibacter sp. CHRR-16 TaxID=2835872 RepID=UPI001BD96F12|nr:SDR family NAD(P)-dependent oxidoreductase [Curvibacter sp. CHRR-16]MBT0569494.1 SDR family NAD(P)-dependent oxidoreductase [Curvibacter sp. CHRR-16]